VIGIRPEPGYDEGQLFWLAVVIQGHTVALKRCRVLGKCLEVGDEYITVRWLEKVEGLDGYRATDLSDVVWESTALLPVKAKLGGYELGEERRKGGQGGAVRRPKAKTLYKLSAVAYSQLTQLALANAEV
jgi:hypothetical protein